MIRYLEEETPKEEMNEAIGQATRKWCSFRIAKRSPATSASKGHILSCPFLKLLESNATKFIPRAGSSPFCCRSKYDVPMVGAESITRMRFLVTSIGEIFTC